MSEERNEQRLLEQKEIEESLRVCREIQEYTRKDRHARKKVQMQQGTRKEIDRILSINCSQMQEVRESAKDTSEELSGESIEKPVEHTSIKNLEEPVEHASAESYENFAEETYEESSDGNSGVTTISGLKLDSDKELVLENVGETEGFVKNPRKKKKQNNGDLHEEYNERHPLFNTFIRILICIAAAVILALLITNFVAHHTSVEGSSMEDTLASGDQLIVENVSYYIGDPKRFDVVVFSYDETTNYIKRIIGLPGETIQIRDGYVYIDGILLDENYGRELINEPGIAENELHLGADEYFVLGDNRNASIDSRDSEVGVVKKDKIEAKAWICFYPFSQVRFIE